MRRILAVALLTVGAVTGVVALLAGPSAGGTHRTVAPKPVSAALTLRPIPLAPALTPVPLGPALRQLPRRLHHAPSINVPAPQGYSCPVAAGPCSKQPCTVYVTPNPTPTIVGPGRLALRVPMRSAPCAKAFAQHVPVMAR